MQITLTSNEIKDAIIASLTGSVSTAGKHVDVTFTSGRSKNTLTANVVVSDSAPAPTPKPASERVPDFNDDSPLSLVSPDEVQEEGTLGDPVQEAETKPTTAGLFTRNPAV